MQKREYFVVQEEGQVVQEGPPLEKDVVTYATLFNLPNDMNNVLMPKFDYILSGLKGSSSNADNTHYVDASDYYGSKDPDVMKDDLKTIDEDKLNIIKANYRDFNLMFLSLSNVSPSLYNRIFQTKSK